MAGNAEAAFGEIRTKYQDFFRPSYKVSVNGQDLAENLQCKIHKVSIKLCLGEPSDGEIEIVNCYDMEQHSIKNNLLSKLLPGSPVEISMGYGSDLSLLFCGYIHCVEMELSEEFPYVLRIKAADVLKLMQEGQGHKRILQVKKYSEAFKEVMKAYTALVNIKADDTSAVLTHGLFQDESDYEFITKRLLKETGGGFELLVENGTAFFRKHDLSQKPVIELSPGQGIKKLCLGLSYLNKVVEVLGYSAEKGSLSALKTVKADKISKNGPTETETCSMPWLFAQEDVDKAVSDYAAYLTGKSKTGMLVTVGLPLLMPGKLLSIANVDSNLDGAFYMTAVQHTLNEDGYATTVWI